MERKQLPGLKCCGAGLILHADGVDVAGCLLAMAEGLWCPYCLACPWGFSQWGMFLHAGRGRVSPSSQGAVRMGCAVPAAFGAMEGARGSVAFRGRVITSACGPGLLQQILLSLRELAGIHHRICTLGSERQGWYNSTAWGLTLAPRGRAQATEWE